MPDRISLGQTYSQARTNIARNYQRLFLAQTRLITGKQILRPSDGAAQTGRLFGLIRQQENLSRYVDTVETALSRVDSAASALTQLSDTVQRTRELAIQASNGVLSQGDRQSIAAELDQLIRSIVSSANAKVEDRYAFGGTLIDRPPFELVTGADGIDRVIYRGNDEVQEIDIGPGIRAELNIPGSRIFSAGERTATSFSGSTGALPGTGNDSGVGRGVLSVLHTSTSYGLPTGAGGQDPVTGLQPSALSPGNDTVLGNGHTLTIQSDASGNGTISLNGGSPVNFTSGDTNLQVTGPNGETIFVDTTAVTPSLPPTTVSIAASGSLSIDGGLSSVPIDFTADNQQVVSSETGQVLHVDSTGITRAGTEEVTYENTDTLFDALIAIRDILRDPNLSSEEAGNRIREHLDDLDRAHSDLLTSLGDLGARHSRFDTTRNRLEDLDITVAGLRSQIEDADIAEVTLDVNRFQTLYQSSLMIASRINQVSLLNFI